VGNIRSRFGFTLIEMLVVIVIIGLLIALILPAIQAVRKASAKANCSNNLKQLGIAAHNFHTANEAFPPGIASSPFVGGAFHIFLLPHLEQNSRYQLFNQTRGIVDPVNDQARMSGDISIMLCPSDNSSSILAGPIGRVSYLGNLGTHANQLDGQTAPAAKLPTQLGMFSVGSKVRMLDIPDGSSNTALMAEIRRGENPSAGRFDVTKLTSWQVSTTSLAYAQGKNTDPLSDSSFIASCNSAVSTDNKSVYWFSVNWNCRGLR